MPETKKTKKVQTNKIYKKYQDMIDFMINMLNSIDMDMKRVKLTLQELQKFDPENPHDIQFSEDTQKKDTIQAYVEEDTEIMEGTFDGYFMVTDDHKKYPVPLNYASKTKLIPGDRLKLKIMEDGKFVYKLIQAAERTHIKALLSKTDDNKFIAVTDDAKTYFLNQAAVTFFKGKPGDELHILINSQHDEGFAAIEAIIKK